MQEPAPGFRAALLKISRGLKVKALMTNTKYGTAAWRHGETWSFETLPLQLSKLPQQVDKHVCYFNTFGVRWDAWHVASGKARPHGLGTCQDPLQRRGGFVQPGKRLAEPERQSRSSYKATEATTKRGCGLLAASFCEGIGLKASQQRPPGTPLGLCLYQLFAQ